MTTHPTDLDTLLKEEPNWVERATEMVARRCDAWTSGFDRLGLIADLAERFKADYAVLLTQVRGIALLREGIDERNDLKNRVRAAEASSLTARRDALEEAAKVADREQDECAEHEDNAFADSVAARWSAAADAAHRIAAGIRTLASTVPGGEETGGPVSNPYKLPPPAREMKET